MSNFPYCFNMSCGFWAQVVTALDFLSWGNQLTLIKRDYNKVAMWRQNFILQCALQARNSQGFRVSKARSYLQQWLDGICCWLTSSSESPSQYPGAMNTKGDFAAICRECVIFVSLPEELTNYVKMSTGLRTLFE